MQRRMSSLLALSVMAAASMTVSSATSAVPSFQFGYAPESKRSGYRQGRRFNYGRGPVAKGGNPAGTKILRQAERGILTISRIR